MVYYRKHQNFRFTDIQVVVIFSYILQELKDSATKKVHDELTLMNIETNMNKIRNISKDAKPEELGEYKMKCREMELKKRITLFLIVHFGSL